MYTQIQTLLDSISALTSSDQKLSIIQKFKFNEELENEFIFFFKPECFNSKTPESTNNIIKMVFSKFEDHHCTVSGAAYLTGKKVDELKVMDKHYGYINKLSKTASTSLSKEEIQSIVSVLEIDDISRYKIMGGHEFIQNYPSFSPQMLDEFWKTKKAIKVRSGFYVQRYGYDGKEFVLVNGFHPLQLYHYTRPDQKIVIMLVQSNQDWKSLKDNLSGDTFPERANTGSIRAEILANKAFYQVEDVSIANNFIHLSAGPYEGLFEIQNFLSGILGEEFGLTQTSMARKMIKEGFSLNRIRYLLSNPTIEAKSQRTDLFTATENMNTQVAIDLAKTIL